MVHVFIVRQLVYHHRLHERKRQPLARVGVFEHQFDFFARVEVAAPELAVGGEFDEGGHVEVLRAHDGEDDGGDALEEVLGDVGIGGGDGRDEGDVGVGGAPADVNTWEGLEGLETG